MKIGDMVLLIQGIQKVMSSDRDIPRQLNFALSINSRRLQPCAEVYDEHVREILEKFVARDKDGKMVPASEGGVRINPERSAEYVEEMRVLRDQDVVVELQKIDFTDIPEAFPASWYAALVPMIREPGVDKATLLRPVGSA